MPPEPSYLVGGYGEIENEIDNLDTAKSQMVTPLVTIWTANKKFGGSVLGSGLEGGGSVFGFGH